MASPMRSMITRSIGQDLICGYDVFNAEAGQGRRAGAMHRRTLFRCAGRPDLRCCGALCRRSEACAELIALAEKRGTEDNVSVQVVRIDEIEQRHFYRGAPYYVKPIASSVSTEIQPGQLLDNRFQITDLINRSGMATIFKATDLKTRRDRGDQGAAHAV